MMWRHRPKRIKTDWWSEGGGGGGRTRESHARFGNQKKKEEKKKKSVGLEINRILIKPPSLLFNIQNQGGCGLSSLRS